jgi:hypothetical protein
LFIAGIKKHFYAKSAMKAVGFFNFVQIIDVRAHSIV